MTSLRATKFQIMSCPYVEKFSILPYPNTKCVFWVGFTCFLLFVMGLISSQIRMFKKMSEANSLRPFKQIFAVGWLPNVGYFHFYVGAPVNNFGCCCLAFFCPYCAVYTMRTRYLEGDMTKYSCCQVDSFARILPQFIFLSLSWTSLELLRLMLLFHTWTNG